MLSKVLQREFTWLKETNNCCILLVWDSIQPKDEISTPPRVTPCNFTTSTKCLELCHHKCSTADATMKFGKGQVMKGMFWNSSLLPCTLLLHKSTPRSLPKATAWGSRVRRRKCAPGQCHQGQQEQVSPRSIPSYRAGICDARHYSLKISVPKVVREGKGRTRTPLVPALPLQTSWRQSILLPVCVSSSQMAKITFSKENHFKHGNFGTRKKTRINSMVWWSLQPK